MDGMKAYKMSLLLDCACIVIACIVLYCANKGLLPMWALITGAMIALGFLVAACALLFKARRAFKEMSQLQRPADPDTTPEQPAADPTTHQPESDPTPSINNKH